MALRSLATEIMFRDKATQSLQGVDSEIDGIRDNVVGTQDNFEDLGYETGEVSYSMQSDLQDVGSATGELEHQTKSLGDRFRGVADSIGRNWNAIAAGAGAAGAAMEAFARQQQEMVESSERLAYFTGETAGEMRELAVESADATFDLEDVYAVMEIGRRQGLESGEQLQEFAEFWDMVGDGARENAVSLADSAMALRAVGIDTENQTDLLGAFGMVHEETGFEIGQFIDFVERSSMAMSELGMDVDDTAALVSLMESELNMFGTRGMREARREMEQAEGDMDVFLEAIGANREQFDALRGSTDDYTGVLPHLADLHAENKTAAQDLQSEVSGLMHLYGAEFMPIIEMLSPVMMGLATTMGVAAGAKYVLGAAALATGGVVVAAIGGIVGAGWLLYDNWGTISGYFAGVWERATQNVDENMETIRSLPGEAKALGQDMIQGLSDGIDSGIDWLRGSITGVADTITGGITDLLGISSPSTVMMDYGINMGEGLELGLEKESRNMLGNMGRTFTPDRDRFQAAGAGAFAPQVSINVNGSSDPEETARAVDRRLNQTFNRHAERYFGRQRRRR